MPWKKPHAWLGAALVIYFLYFFHLTATGMLGPDEPRYAAIGREMARSGDWVTPRLWGEPWFEKPPLIYWMTASAFRLGLGEDLAPRLPVAMVSVAFLVLFFRLLRRDFGVEPAFFASAILATTAGWIGLSQAGVPDVPLAASFSLAVLLAGRWIREGDRRCLSYASACLGIAMLAKGLLPLALVPPVLWAGRRRWTDLLRPSAWLPCLLVAAPWYIACYVKNGRPFLEKFFWQHHVERFVNDSLQHGQPVWFYLPVMLAGLFPWTPLVALVYRKQVRTLAGLPLLVAAYGLVFFSCSVNKLPEYLLPLIPSLAAAMGIGLASIKARTATRLLALCVALAALGPVFSDILPQALAGGITRARLAPAAWLWILPLLLGPIALRLRPPVGVAAIGATVTAAVVFLKLASLPLVDQAVSARPLWRQIVSVRDQVCLDPMHRRYQYGFNYYSVKPLPECSAEDRGTHVVQAGSTPPRITPAEQVQQQR
jgi:4-amino-4-deoxy-L-arabinose transferase-like glycosyltransferase